MLPRKTLLTAVSIALLAILCGCGDVYHIRKFDKNKPNGIPFYVKVGKCMQQTVKAAPYYRIAFQISASGDVKSFSANLTPEFFKSNAVNDFLAAASDPKPTVARLLELWQEIVKHDIDPLNRDEKPDPLKFRIVSNSSSPVTLVDYTKENTYSGNAKSHFFGERQCRLQAVG